MSPALVEGTGLIPGRKRRERGWGSSSRRD